MWKDYCARLKQTKSGMGALKNDELVYESIARAAFQPQLCKKMQEPQVLFPSCLCPSYDEEGEDKNLQTQIIWSPLFDESDLCCGAEDVPNGPDLPAGWRTAEQKMLEMKCLDRCSTTCDFVNLVSSSASNSDDDPPSVWSSAKCLLHMKGILDSTDLSRGADEGLLEFTTCDLGVSAVDDPKKNRNVVVEGIELKNFQSEVSVEGSKYHTCSGGDSSVCSLESTRGSSTTGIGRGRLEKHENVYETGLKNSSRAMDFQGRDRKHSASSTARPTQRSLDNSVDKRAKRGYLHQMNVASREEKAGKVTSFRAPRATTVTSSNKGTMQRYNRKEAQRPPKETATSKVDAGKHLSIEKKKHWCSQKRILPSVSDEVLSVASTIGDEESVGTTRDPQQEQQEQQQQYNAEVASALADINLRELRTLQCSVAFMRHNIGVLEDDVKGLQGCLEGRKFRYSWWTLVKDFIVAAGLVSGAFGLRTVVDILRKNTVRYGTLRKITNKQEKMALAAFLLTAGARLGKQLWHDKGNASTTRPETSLREQLDRIKERVALMSHLASTTSSSTTACSVHALPPEQIQ